MSIDDSNLTVYIYERLCKLIDEYKFVGVVCDDGHEHTVKAYDVVCGTPYRFSKSNLLNQFIYILSICNNRDVDILIADSEEEAIEKGILYEDGNVI